MLSARWLWWAPLGCLIAFFALTGLRYGWIAATITETDVVNRYAERYVQTQGGDARVTDCVAYPGADIPGIWIVVNCMPQAPGGEGRSYYVNRLGGLEYGETAGPPDRPRPQT